MMSHLTLANRRQTCDKESKKEIHMHFALGLIKHIEDDIAAGLVPTLEVLEMLKKAIEDMEEGE